MRISGLFLYLRFLHLKEQLLYSSDYPFAYKTHTNKKPPSVHEINQRPEGFVVYIISWPNKCIGNCPED